MSKHETENKRTVRSVYYGDYNGRKVVKITHGLHPESMVSNCIYHMRRNDYEALLAEVWDDDDGVLHAIVKCRISGELGIIEILYQREIKE
jgi:hypothetical protein